MLVCMQIFITRNIKRVAYCHIRVRFLYCERAQLVFILLFFDLLMVYDFFYMIWCTWFQNFIFFCSICRLSYTCDEFHIPSSISKLMYTNDFIEVSWNFIISKLHAWCVIIKLIRFDIYLRRIYRLLQLRDMKYVGVYIVVKYTRSGETICSSFQNIFCITWNSNEFAILRKKFYYFQLAYLLYISVL